MESVTFSSNCLGTIEDSKFDDLGFFLVWGGFCLPVSLGFLTRSSKKIQKTTRRAIELYLRLETSQDLSYWYKTNVGIERKDYSAWKLMLQSVGGKPCNC